jgi:hypothetical protein
VIEPPANVQTRNYPYLVESLILRSRWWVNERGEPDNIYSPHLIVATSGEGEIESEVGASVQGQVSGGKYFRSVSRIAKESATQTAIAMPANSGMEKCLALKCAGCCPQCCPETAG